MTGVLLSEAQEQASPGSTLLFCISTIASRNACFDRLQISLSVRSREEAGIAFLNVDALGAHAVIEQASEARIMREGEVEPRGKVMDAAGHAAFGEEAVE